MLFTLILHNLLRWLILFFGAWTVIDALTGVIGKRNFTKGDNLGNLLFMISCDVQLLLGLILYFAGPWFGLIKDNAKMVMSNNSLRFFSMEHEIMMIAAWILVHVGRAAVKKAPTDAAKHQRMLLFFGIAFLIILVSIPWPFRQEIARPWFRF